MSNDLIIKDRPSFLPAAAGTSSVMSEFLGGLGGSAGPDMPILSIRGKGFRLRRDGQEVSLKASQLDVMLVASRANNSRRFYAGQYVPGEINPPTCASSDGAHPDSNVTEKQAEACATCPRNVWGSKVTASGGKGKQCDDYRRVLLFIPSKQILKPVILDIPATSLKKKKGETGPEMQLREYLTAMARHGIEPHQAVTTLAFTDDEYPRLTFTFARWATAEEYQAAMTARESDEVALALDYKEDEVVAGPIVEAPAPAPSPKPKAEPVAEEFEEVEEEPTPKSKPKAEKAPEPAAVADADLDDILALLD